MNSNIPTITLSDSPLRQSLRARLHTALDQLIDAKPSDLDGAELAEADNAFVVLLNLARRILARHESATITPPPSSESGVRP